MLGDGPASFLMCVCVCVLRVSQHALPGLPARCSRLARDQTVDGGKRFDANLERLLLVSPPSEIVFPSIGR